LVRESCANSARAERDRRLDQTDELIRFVGELNRRTEIVFQSVVRELREMRRETRASTREILARAADNSELMKAHAEAIFALIDRLEGGSGGVAPAT
jgi:hypothetical protein